MVTENNFIMEKVIAYDKDKKELGESGTMDFESIFKAKKKAGVKHIIVEVEDYNFTPDVSITICEDYDGDGVTDLNDLAALVADWLENCP